MPLNDLQPTPEDEKIDVSEDYGTSNPDPRCSIGDLIEARYGRRMLFGASAAAAALAALPDQAAAQAGGGPFHPRLPGTAPPARPARIGVPRGLRGADADPLGRSVVPATRPPSTR